MTPSSLTPSFQQELLQQEPTFLSVALQMYIQLLQLFVEGQVLPQSDQDSTEQVSKAWTLYSPVIDSQNGLGWKLP